LGKIVRIALDGLGDYQYDTGDYSDYGGGSGSVNYGDASGGYSNEPTDTPAPVDYTSLDTTSNSSYDPTLQAQAEDTGLVLTAQGTSSLPTSAQAQGTLVNWGDDLSSFVNNLLGAPTLAKTPIVGASTPTATPKVTTPAKPVVSTMPKASPSKPKAVANKPNVNVYEALFAANLNAFMASGKTSADQSAGENYFVQEWAVFASDMNSAGSWGTTGLAQRNRGGTYDWWAKYYDPIANYLVTNTGVTSSTTGVSNSGLLWLVLAGVIVWWMTE
jgi:hypothetical protein